MTLPLPRLNPLYDPAAMPAGRPRTGEASQIAARIARVAPAEPVRTLEALAVAEANRLRHQSPAAPVPLQTQNENAPGERYRRIARRALAGALDTPVGAAVAYHRDGPTPPWAAGRQPVAEVGGFVFYAPETADAAGPV